MGKMMDFLRRQKEAAQPPKAEQNRLPHGAKFKLSTDGCYWRGSLQIGGIPLKVAGLRIAALVCIFLATPYRRWLKEHGGSKRGVRAVERGAAPGSSRRKRSEPADTL